MEARTEVTGSAVVVGASLSGLIAALALARTGMRVTILEGGGKINGGMLRAGLSDEASVLVAAFDELTRDVLFGDVWERPGLSKRDRSLITVATLVAGYRTNELPFHMKRALENGVTKDELTELVMHLAFYAGWPAANTAVGIARQVFSESTK
jgi:4-carboxymuconolactone decarboxylase